jgi:hypothetical protein
VAHRRELDRALVAAFALACGALASSAGCGGPPKTPDDATTIPTGDTPAASSDTPASNDPPKGGSSDKGGGDDAPLTEDQKAQMEIALRRGGDKAANCASVVPDAARGEGEVKVTFDGKKGRATDVAVGPPWVGTAAESCIKRAFVGEIIVPFEGELEVPYTVKLPQKGDDPDKGKKKDPKKDPKKK